MLRPIPLDPASGPDQPTSGPRGIVLSDLHLMSGRERPEIEALLKETHPHYAHWVFNGDILDLKWAAWEPAETARRAVEWMTDFALRHAPAQVHWVMGNHDGYSSLQNALSEMSLPGNLHWYAEYCLLGDHLFLHGDLLLLRRPQARRFWPTLPATPKTDKARRQYDHAMKMHLHRAAALLMQPRLLVPWMARHLPLLHPEAWNAARHIVTGHSHHAYHRVFHGGKLWSNTGSAVRGIRFAPCSFTLGTDLA